MAEDRGRVAELLPVQELSLSVAATLKGKTATVEHIVMNVKHFFIRCETVERGYFPPNARLCSTPEPVVGRSRKCVLPRVRLLPKGQVPSPIQAIVNLATKADRI